MAYVAPTTRANGYVVDASEWNQSVVDNVKYFKDAPQFDGAVTASSTLTVANNVGIAATKKLYLDGVAMSGDTYISESAGNVLSLYSGGVESKLTSGVLTVSGFGSHGFNASGTGFNILGVRNPTAGTGNGSALYIGNDSSAFAGSIEATSSTYTASGVYPQNGVVLWAGQAGGLSIVAANASGTIRFYSSGTTLRGTFATDGSLHLEKDLFTKTGVAIGTNDNPHFISPSSQGISSATLYIGNASINVTSDRRLKRDITPTVIDAGALLTQLAVVDYVWDDPSDTSYNNRNARGRWTGLIAQDTVGVMPWVVNAPRHRSDLSIDWDSPEPWHIEFDHIVPVLVKGWQQHEAILAGIDIWRGHVEARIAALESKLKEKQ